MSEITVTTDNVDTNTVMEQSNDVSIQETSTENDVKEDTNEQISKAEDYEAYSLFDDYYTEEKLLLELLKNNLPADKKAFYLTFYTPQHIQPLIVDEISWTILYNSILRYQDYSFGYASHHIVAYGEKLIKKALEFLNPEFEYYKLWNIDPYRRLICEKYDKTQLNEFPTSWGRLRLLDIVHKGFNKAPLSKGIVIQLLADTTKFSAYHESFRNNIHIMLNKFCKSVSGIYFSSYRSSSNFGISSYRIECENMMALFYFNIFFCFDYVLKYIADATELKNRQGYYTEVEYTIYLSPYTSIDYY